MTCKKCGKEVRDGIAFCPFCGASLKEEPVVAVEPVKASEPVIKKEVVKKEKKPINKKPFIIGGIAVAVIAVVVACVMLFVGRNIDKTIEKYMEAIRQEDEELLLEIMFPKDARDDGEDWYADGAIDDLLEDMNEEVKSISVVNSVDADEKVSAMIDEIFDEADIDVEYTALKIVNINIQYKKDAEREQTTTYDINGNVLDDNKELSQLIAYKVGNKWYILPGVFEYCVDVWQSEDIQSAEEISTAIQSALCSEEVYNSFQPYYDVVIDLESDLEYLPESVQAAIMGYLNSVPEIQHTYDGATGFSFVVSSNGIVTVYISTETNPAEWQVYPTVESGYDYGVVDEITTEDMPVNPEYSYVKLISEQSPIMGYWQSDTVGMYIGYNVSGGDEGFTVYLQSQDFGFRLLHSYKNYKYSGGNSFVQFIHEPQYETNWCEKFKIDVIDNDTITLSTSDIGQNDVVCLEPQEYTFKRAELDKETLLQYEGTWIDGGDVFSNYGTYGNIKDLAYCDECGSIHDKDYVEKEYNCYHSSNYVSLYDGKTLHYIFPSEGLYIEELDAVCYTAYSYYVDDNKMDYESGAYGGGGSEYYIYFRDGSDEAKVAEALNAYQGYIDENNLDIRGYELVYINDDDIPELCAFDIIDDPRLLLYNATDKDVKCMYSSGGYQYKERENIIVVFSHVGGSEAYSLMEINDSITDFVELDYVRLDRIDDNYVYYYNDEVSDEATYNAFIEKYREYTQIGVSRRYTTILEAYENLGITEYGYSLYHIEAMSYDNGVLYIKGDDGEEISYPVADDCVWEDTAFSEVIANISYEELEDTWLEEREYYLTYEENNYNFYDVYVVVKDEQIIRVYTAHN